MLNVGDDADNLHPWRFVQWSIETNAFADRVLTRPVLSRKRFVHDHNWRRACFILLCKTAALNNRDSHGAEVIRRGDAITALVLLPRRRLRFTFNQIGVR